MSTPGEHGDRLSGDRYEEAPCGLVTMRLDGSIVEVNRTFVEWVEIERDELVGTPFPHRLAPGARVFFETHCRPLLVVQHRVQEIALELVALGGRRRSVLMSAVVQPATEERSERCHLVLFEATERRSYERELVDARRRAEASEARARLLAETLQESLLPHELPQIEHLELAARYRPAGDGAEIGGDFYDVFELGRRDWMVVIGDVCGKGAPAATVTALARYTIRAAAISVRRPRQVLATLNDALLRQQVQRFCTVGCARLRLPNPSSSAPVRATLSSGGHPLPFLVSADRVEPVGRPGTLLGVFADVRLHDVRIDLAAGDTLVWFTDGVTEARDGTVEFGDERVRSVLAAVAGRPADDVVDALVDAVLAFQGGRPRDDIAVVALRVAP